jgi:hypothetical protein
MSTTFAMAAFGCPDKEQYAEALLADLSGMDSAGWDELRAAALSLDHRLGAVLMEHMVAPGGTS